MQKRCETSLKLSVTHFKILLTVKMLNEENKYPTSKGVRNILKGKEDAETILYKDLSTYATLVSTSSRKFAGLVNNLLRHNYLAYIYDKKSDALYLSVTNSGSLACDEFIKNHKKPFNKKISHIKREIIEIK